MTSIIILSRNTKDYTKMCIQSIRRYTEPGTYEIIVVENGSVDGSLDWLVAQPDIHLIINEDNKGFPKGCNQGLCAATGENLLLLNSDTIATPRWLAQLTAALRSSPGIGAVSCMTNNCAELQRLDVSYSSISGLQEFAENHNHSDPGKWHPAFTLIGFCYLLRREVYEAIGGLDEAFSPGNFEDDDYSFRIRQAGWKLLLLKDTFIHHFGSVSFQNETKADVLRKKKIDYDRVMEKNLAYLKKKWDLAPEYGVMHPWIQELQLPQPSPRILFLHGAANPDAFLLLERCPRASISFLTDRKGDAENMSWDFDSTWCRNIEGEVAHLLDGKQYDLILCLRPVETYRSPSSFLQQLSRHLSPGGRLLYCSSDRVLAYPSAPVKYTRSR